MRRWTVDRQPRPENWVPHYVSDPLEAYEQGADDIYQWAYQNGFETAMGMMKFVKGGGQQSRRGSRPVSAK